LFPIWKKNNTLLQIIFLEIAQDLSYQKICLEFYSGMGTTISVLFGGDAVL